MNLFFKTLLLTSSLLFVIAPAQADEITPKTPTNTQVNIKLKGYIFGLRVMRAEYQTQFSNTEYNAQAELKTSGLGAFLKKFKIWSATEGHFDGTELLPSLHVQQNMDKKNRRVHMRYNNGVVETHIVPRLGSQGKPPASPQQRFESDDTLSALLNLMMRGTKTSSEVCTGKIPVFDSKQHYNLRLQKAGTRRIKQKGFKGETIRCHVFYEPVSGFDPEDLPSTEEKSAPIIMYLAYFKQADIYIPVRMTYKISGLKAVIKAREITITHNIPTPIHTIKELSNVKNPLRNSISSTPDLAVE
ncbi:MAG: hypothetical protein COA43_13975 [Robiginitomaculum sp.]|nr:MAG: hypothetical protein COA43_13975 [Robiginitomaculum sp.]